MWSLFKLVAVVWLLLCLYVAIMEDPQPRPRPRPQFREAQAALAARSSFINAGVDHDVVNSGKLFSDPNTAE